MEISLDIPPDTKAVMHIDETDHIGKFVVARGWYEKDLLDDRTHLLAQRLPHGIGELEL